MYEQLVAQEMRIAALEAKGCEFENQPTCCR